MENISVSEVRSRLQAGENLNLVDVREADENAEFNIGGILLPLEKIQNLEFDDIEDLKDEDLDQVAGGAGIPPSLGPPWDGAEE